MGRLCRLCSWGDGDLSQWGAQGGLEARPHSWLQPGSSVQELQCSGALSVPRPCSALHLFAEKRCKGRPCAFSAGKSSPLPHSPWPRLGTTCSTPLLLMPIPISLRQEQPHGSPTPLGAPPGSRSPGSPGKALSSPPSHRRPSIRTGGQQCALIASHGTCRRCFPSADAFGAAVGRGTAAQNRPQLRHSNKSIAFVAFIYCVSQPGTRGSPGCPLNEAPLPHSWLSWGHREPHTQHPMWPTLLGSHSSRVLPYLSPSSQPCCWVT